MCPTCYRLEAHEAQENEGRIEPARPRPDLNRAPPLVRAEPGAAELSDDAIDLRQVANDGLASDGSAEDPDMTGPHAHERGLAAEMGFPPVPALERESDRPLGLGSAAAASTSLPLKNPAVPKRSRLPRVGPSLAAGVEAAHQAAAPATDHSILRALEAARPHGLEILHSRPWTGTRVESEAIVVGPSGVWVVDGLGSPADPIERGFLAGHGGSELLNVVGGRASVISGLLFDSPFQWVPVRGALCFDNGVPSWFEAPFSLAGISITTPRDLIDSLFTPLHLDAETRSLTAAHLASRF